MIQDGFAIYTPDKCEIDVHINVWTNLKNANYIDIGLRIYKKDNFDTISVYIPYHISQNEVFDLSDVLKGETVMRGIFNQKCSITISSIESYYDVQLTDHSLRIIPIGSCIKNVTNIENGTIISFAISQWSVDNIAYIRFRLPYKSLSDHLSAKKPIYIEALESPIMKESYPYNFKLNESRTLPREVLKFIGDPMTIKTINFFLCMPDKCSISPENAHKTRIIENEVFKPYVPCKQFEKSSIAYQWRYRKTKKYTLSIFLRKKYINWVSVIFYASAVIILNIISNFFFQFILLS